MRILFVTSAPFLSEPLGSMLLAGICRSEGHEVGLTTLQTADVVPAVSRFRPEVIAYSTMSSELPAFARADEGLRVWMSRTGRQVYRIMGGPHATFCPSVVDELRLDAICQGDGDAALPELLRRLERGACLTGIPNLATGSGGAPVKQLYENLDALPFAWREDYYRAVPYCRESGLRSFVASRGCPYDCTYCFNHAFKDMFKGCGPLLRRRSVEHLISEIEYVVRTWPPVRLVRFGDDTFSYRADDWLEEFVRQYRNRVGLPFYCLMRSNTLTDETARMLATAGCRSLSMSLESGSQRIRNDYLKRHLTDDVVLRSFETARKYGMRVFANTMLGIPGTNLKDDLHSLEFARRVRPSAPTFTICCPYPGTSIWERAVEEGHLDAATPVNQKFQELSILKTYTDAEKRVQARMCYLGTLYCYAPRPLLPLLRLAMRLPLPLRLLSRVGLAYSFYRLATRILPQAIPHTPGSLFRLIRDTFRTFGLMRPADEIRSVREVVQPTPDTARVAPIGPA